VNLLKRFVTTVKTVLFKKKKKAFEMISGKNYK